MSILFCGCDHSFECDCNDAYPTAEERTEEWRMLAADSDYPAPVVCEVCGRKRHVFDTEFVRTVRGRVYSRRVEVCRACLEHRAFPVAFLTTCRLTIVCFVRCFVLFNYQLLRDRLSDRLRQFKRAACIAAIAHIRTAFAFLFRQFEIHFLKSICTNDLFFRIDVENKGLSVAIFNRACKIAPALRCELAYRICKLKRNLGWRLREIRWQLCYGHILLPIFPLGLFFRLFHVALRVAKRLTFCSWRAHGWCEQDGAPVYRCLACGKRQRLFPPLVYVRNTLRALRSQRRRALLVRLFAIYMMKDARSWEVAWLHRIIKRTPDDFERAFAAHGARLLRTIDLRRLEAYAREKGHAHIAEMICARRSTTTR